MMTDADTTPSEGEVRSSKKRTTRSMLARWILLSALLPATAVPSCFYTLPPDVDELDRWVVAVGIMALALPFLMMLILIKFGKNLRRRGIVGLLAITITSWGLTGWLMPSIPSIDNRRYCQAHQTYARADLKKLLVAEFEFADREGRYATLKELDIDPKTWRSTHFEYNAKLKENPPSFVLEAVGTGFQTGCRFELDENNTMQSPPGARCADICD